MASILIRDTEAPVITVPPDTTVECDAIPDSIASAPVVDQCDPNPSLSSADKKSIIRTCPNNYTLTRTWTANDKCGNFDEERTSYTVIDVKAPEFQAAPQRLELECDGAGNIAEVDNWIRNNGNGQATDACPGQVSWSSNILDVRLGLIDSCAATGTM